MIILFHLGVKSCAVGTNFHTTIKTPMFSSLSTFFFFVPCSTFARTWIRYNNNNVIIIIIIIVEENAAQEKYGRLKTLLAERSRYVCTLKNYTENEGIFVIPFFSLRLNRPRLWHNNTCVWLIFILTCWQWRLIFITFVEL